MLKCGLSAMFSKKHIASCNLLQCENTMSREQTSDRLGNLLSLHLNVLKSLDRRTTTATRL